MIGWNEELWVEFFLWLKNVPIVQIPQANEESIDF